MTRKKLLPFQKLTETPSVGPSRLHCHLISQHGGLSLLILLRLASQKTTPYDSEEILPGFLGSSLCWMSSGHRAASVLKISRHSCLRLAAVVTVDPSVNATVSLVTAPPSNSSWTAALPQTCAVAAVAARHHRAEAGFRPWRFGAATADWNRDHALLGGP